MGKLLDILNQGTLESLKEEWDRSEAAGESGPVPPGDYIAHIIEGNLDTSKKKGTPGFKLTFRVCEGDYAGRLFWHDIWLTPAALPFAKRELGKIGVSDLSELERPVPQGIRCLCTVLRQFGEDGGDYNRVRTFQVIAIDEPEADASAPSDAMEAKAGSAGAGEDATDGDTRSGQLF